MEVAHAFASGSHASPAEAVRSDSSEAPRALSVTATFVLSEEGRKASLLSGGNGHAVQELTVHVPSNRLHLVSVDANGVARLKLRPRFEPADSGVTRIDAPPTYDAPPTLEELFRDAARNHQLERTYHTERRAARSQRHDAQRQQRTQLAEAFLHDPTQRALVHPAPTPHHCWLNGPNGRVAFDTTTDDPLARQIPPEAHRRFRADLRTRREQNLQQRSEQLAIHGEKKRWLAEWIAGHGTPEQQARQNAGVLPIEEAIDAVTDETFRSAERYARYSRDGVMRLEAQIRQSRDGAAIVLTSDDVMVTSIDATEMTASQWTAVEDLRRLLPMATVTLRVHRVVWKRDRRIALSPAYGLLVTQRVGPFTIRREYAMPTPSAPAIDATDTNARGQERSHGAKNQESIHFGSREIDHAIG